jgi:hypothetical protein
VVEEVDGKVDILVDLVVEVVQVVDREDLELLDHQDKVMMEDLVQIIKTLLVGVAPVDLHLLNLEINPEHLVV